LLEHRRVGVAARQGAPTIGDDSASGERNGARHARTRVRRD
jgi:hypothetical protein